MTTLGAALLIDHVWLIGKRDALKTATDAAAIASTQALHNNPAISDEELQAIADRYVLLNLVKNIPDQELDKEDVIVTLEINRPAGIVNVETRAPIGGVLMEFLHDAIPGDMFARAGAESFSQPVAVVLAIDASESMNLDLAGKLSQTPSRLDIVMDAALELVNILEPDPATPVLLGIVPWNEMVCFTGQECANAAYATVTDLTGDRTVLQNALVQFEAVGQRTRSAGGINAATVMLSAVEEGVHRALVLLTDGEDNMDAAGNSCLLNTNCTTERQIACYYAKQADIEVFVITAMTPANVSSDLEQELRACASSTENTHVFVNNASEDNLRTAFSHIGGQLKTLRRLH